MTHSLGAFPFGEPVKKVEQQDRDGPKPMFVLGVYASAVHARWLDPAGRTVVRALAVASEPGIFWRGDGVEAIVAAIQVPHDVGRLVPAAPNLNGPSGRALDTSYLEPLGYTRSDVWLCDLVPHACMNPGQERAIRRAYMPAQALHHLPDPSVPLVPTQFSDASRRAEIRQEFQASQAEILVTLGDKPLQWFVNQETGRRYTLRQFGTTAAAYGRLHPVQIGEHHLHLLPLAHPRQVARLGHHSEEWAALHEQWVQTRARPLLR